MTTEILVIIVMVLITIMLLLAHIYSVLKDTLSELRKDKRHDRDDTRTS